MESWNEKLTTAARDGDIEALKLSLQNGADIDYRDELLGQTALMRAAGRGQLEICRLLIDTGCKIDITEVSGWTALMFAARFGHLEICRFLIDTGCKIDITTSEEGETALMVAAVGGHLEICKLLIDRGCKIDITSGDGVTALMLAAWVGSLEICRFLIDRGCKIDTTTRDGYTALHYAAEEGYLQTTRCLVERGASPLVTTHKGKTPYDLAAKEEKGQYKEVMEYLQTVMSKKSSCVTAELGIEDDVVPTEIKLMADKRSIDLYLKLLESGSEKKRDIRLVVVGKQGAGKTSLIRRLFGEDITDVTSTNGIEIHKIKCKAMSDDGIWNKLDGTNEETELHARLLKPFKGTIEASVEGVHHTVKENTSFDKSETVTQPKKRKIQVTTESKVEPPATSQQPNLSLEQAKIDIETMLKSNVDLHDKEEYANLLLWDFAGDEEFYHTHQTFLSQDAIYLVVTKLNEADDKNAQDMFQLWMNSIHCYCRLDDQKNKAESNTGEMHERMIAKDDCLDPPVVLVGSHRDKVEHSSGQTIEDACKERIYKYISPVSEDACKHIREEYFISNTEDENSKFKHIRQGILNLARTMRAWNKDYPLKFIQLEKLLQEKKKDLSIPIISFEDIKSISTESQKPLSDEELKLYLKFHHEIRALVYFEDLPDYIILDTQWLSDAFKHIVTAEKFQSSVRRYWNKSKWNDLRDKGVLHSEVLEDIFKQDETISKYKDHILNVMEKFDIIIRSNVSERIAAYENLCYYVPCMIKEESQRDIYEMLNLTENTFEKSTWLYFVFRFLPPHLMNHLIASLCRTYNLTEVVVPNQQKRIALLRDAAVFEVQKTKLRKLLVSTGPNSIQIQVLEFETGIKRGLYKPIANFVREELEKIIETRFKMSNVKFEERWECGLTKSDFVTGSNGFSMLSGEQFTQSYRCETCAKNHEFIGEWSGQPYDVYEKKEGQRGLVLIVNFKFSGNHERQGSEVDVTNLKDFFSKLGYQVVCKSDMTKRELEDCFQDIERKYLTEKSKDYHSFICVIMSHGNEKGISTKEKNVTISEQEITEPFKNKDGGKFNGKPKLFLFQSCRGQQKQMKFVVPDSDEPSGSIGIDSNDALVNKVPTDADILVAHATTPGYFSFRNTEDGTYFIRAFLSIAKKKYKVCHVEEMLIDVRRELAKNSKYEIQLGHFVGSCQTSVSQSTYIKKFFL